MMASPTSPEEIERCHRAMAETSDRWQAWARTPEGRAALDREWRKVCARIGRDPKDE